MGFDVLVSPECTEQRAQEISQGNSGKFEDIFRIYDNAFFPWYRSRKDAEFRAIEGMIFQVHFLQGQLRYLAIYTLFGIREMGAFALYCRKAELAGLFNG